MEVASLWVSRIAYARTSSLDLDEDSHTGTVIEVVVLETPCNVEDIRDL